MEGFASLCRLAELGFCVFGFLLFFLEVGDEDWFGLGFLQTQKKARSRSWSGRVACKGGDGGVNVVALLLAAAMLAPMFALAL